MVAPRAPRPLDAFLAAAGTAALVAAWLGSGMTTAVALAVPAFLLMLAHRGALMPILVALYFPATIDLGLPFGTITLLYYFCYGALLLHTVRYGVGKSWRAVLVLIPMVAGALFIGFGHSGFTEELSIVGRPLLAAVALALVLVRAAELDPQALRKSLVIALWVGASVAVLAVYQTATDTWPVLDDYASAPQYRSVVYFGRPGGTQGHPIILAAVMTAMVVVAFVLRPRLWRVAAALCALAVVLSGSRSAFLALAVALLMMFLARKERRSLSMKQLVGTGSVAVLGVVLAARLNETVSAQLGSVLERLSLAGDDSADARSDRISAAWLQINASSDNFWLGQGPRADAKYALSRGFGDGGSALTFDNTYLIWWFNYGLIGTVLLVATLVALWRAGGRLSRPLVGIVAAEMLFFDFTGWVAALGLISLAAAAAVYDRDSDPDPGRSRGDEGAEGAGRKGDRRSGPVDGLAAGRGNRHVPRGGVLQGHAVSRVD